MNSFFLAEVQPIMLAAFFMVFIGKDGPSGISIGAFNSLIETTLEFGFAAAGL